MMQRRVSFGGIFLLFLLFFAIISCIQPDTATITEDTIPKEVIIPYTEDTISSTEDTVTWAEDTLFC